METRPGINNNHRMAGERAVNFRSLIAARKMHGNPGIIEIIAENVNQKMEAAAGALAESGALFLEAIVSVESLDVGKSVIERSVG